MAREGDGGGIARLTKPEVQRVQRAAAVMKDFEDEKRNVYQKHMNIAQETFEKARQVRASIMNEYENRNRLIHDKVAELRSRNQQETNKNLEGMKAYSRAFDDGLVMRRERWKNELKVGRETLQRRVGSNDADFTRLDGLIQEEHELCKKTTADGIGPIWEKLREQRDALNSTVTEREGAHKEWVDGVAEHFERLRAMLSEEAAVRTKECVETQAAARKSYAELDSRQEKQDADVRRRLAELRELVAVEKADAANSNNWLTHEMVQYMLHFENNVTESQSKQDATKKYLQTLKSAFDFKQ